MRIIFFGTPQFAVPSLEKLLSHPDFTVVATVTQPDKRRGRGNQLTPSPIKKIALDHEIPVFQPTRIKKNADTLDYLEQAEADAFVVVAYGQILSPKILAMPRLGCINVHGSLLPKYRGAAPIQWSLFHGDRQTGITTMLMDKGMDTGPMLLKREVDIALLDNAWDIASNLAETGADLLIETLLKLDQGEITAIAQESSAATYAPRIEKSDYDIDWSKPAMAIHNQVRGFYPVCSTQLRGKRLKLMATLPLATESDSSLPAEFESIVKQLTDFSQAKTTPGEVLTVVKNVGPIVATGEGLLLLREVQLAGKRPQSGWDFVNGTRLMAGERLIAS